MVLKDIDALLITNPINIRYLTGFVGAAPEEREAYVLLTQNVGYLFTNALYRESAKNVQCPMPNVQWKTVEISRDEPFAKKLAEVLTGSRHVKRLGFEEDDLTVAEHRKLTHVLKNVTLIPTRDRIEELRMIKREDEIENIRGAAKLTDQCFDFILGKLKPGVSEGDIALAIESFIRTHGGQLAFSPIVAFGRHSSQPHYLTNSFARRGLAKLNVYSSFQSPQSNQSLDLKSNDIILMDFGAKVNRYCSDMTRVVFIGKPKDEWVKTYNTVLRAQSTTLEYLASRPGLEATGNTADRLARELIEKDGFPPYPHSLGHGVGLAIHEAPRLTHNPSTRSGQALKPGMVVTIEPGIYIEGNYGIRIEDLVLLKKDGIEILSQSPKTLTIL